MLHSSQSSRARIGSVASPEQWRWSSFRWYLYGEEGPVRINDTDIMVIKIHPPTSQSNRSKSPPIQHT
jgi:hypothetical protein